MNSNLMRTYIDILKEKSKEEDEEDDEEQEDDEELYEKWGKPTVVSPEEKGKYKGRSLADLRKSYNALKNSGPHKKGSPEYGRMRELAFAIRAKTGWGKM